MQCGIMAKMETDKHALTHTSSELIRLLHAISFMTFPYALTTHKGFNAQNLQPIKSTWELKPWGLHARSIWLSFCALKGEGVGEGSQRTWDRDVRVYGWSKVMQIRQARAFLEEEQGQELPLGQASQNQNLLSTNNRLRSPRDQARSRQVVIPIDKDTVCQTNTHTYTLVQSVSHTLLLLPLRFEKELLWMTVSLKRSANRWRVIWVSQVLF